MNTRQLIGSRTGMAVNTGLLLSFMVLFVPKADAVIYANYPVCGGLGYGYNHTAGCLNTHLYGGSTYVAGGANVYRAGRYYGTYRGAYGAAGYHSRYGMRGAAGAEHHGTVHHSTHGTTWHHESAVGGFRR